MIPRKTDRMPEEKADQLPVEHVIAISLNSVSYEFWKHGKISESSEPVRAVMNGLRLAKYKIVPIGEG